MSTPLWVVSLARIPYDEALSLQLAALSAVQLGTIPDTLLLLEHPPVITLGRASHAEHLLADPALLEERGVTLHEITRGGDVTFHGPGQLVGYPILDLNRHGKDVHRYVRGLEEVLIQALAAFGVEAVREPKLTGVWVGQEKIAAIGVAIRKWATFHGFALNVTTDLSYFDLIVPCGIRDRGVTSLERLRSPCPSRADVEQQVVAAFARALELTPEPVSEVILRKRVDEA